MKCVSNGIWIFLGLDNVILTLQKNGSEFDVFLGILN